MAVKGGHGEIDPADLAHVTNLIGNKNITHDSCHP